MKATLQRHTTNICTTLLTNPDVFRLAVHCLQTEHTRQKTHQKTHCRELVAAVCVSGVKIGKRDHHIDLHCSHLSFPCPTITASCRSMQSSRFHLAAESVRRSAESMGRNTESPPKAARTRKYTPPATATVSKQAGAFDNTRANKRNAADAATAHPTDATAGHKKTRKNGKCTPVYRMVNPKLRIIMTK